jgi:tetratricopeptide (TPR) repeat protein
MKVLLLAALLPFVSPRASDERLEVAVERLNGELVCDITSHNAPLYEVLRELSERGDLELDGFDGEWRKVLVTAQLERRPLRQALSFLLGSVDLAGDVRQGAIFVHATEAPETAEELNELAVGVYQRVLRSFPDHASAAEVMLRLAQVEEARGNMLAARSRYEALIARYPEADLVADALIEIGRSLLAEENWEEARVRFEELLRIERPHAYQEEARIDLVRCLSRTGAAEKALNILEQLELASPARSLDESVDRRLLRARCLVELGSHAEALELLDGIPATRLDEAMTRSYLELLARGAAGSGDSARAARQWLAYSRAVEGEAHVDALREAARAALAVEDELGVLFAAQLARREGLADPGLDALVTSAQTRLSIESPSVDAVTLRQRVERGERQLAAGLKAECFETLRSIARSADELAPDLRLRFALAYAAVLASEVNVDAAVALLRESVPSQSDPEARARIYVLAGELLERAERLDEAVEAYQGRL